MTEHWGLPDPAAVAGSEAVQRFAFVDALRILTRRIEIFADLPMAALERLTPQQPMDDSETIRRAMPQS